MKTPITFGTSGHRGIIDDTFTHDHVSRIAYAVASLYKQSLSSAPKICIGFDPRKGNDPTLENGSFTRTLVDSLLQNGVDVIICNEYVPTPLISWYVKHNQLDGGFMMTASHNPPQYNGVKFNPNDGQPAPPTLTRSIESLANSDDLSHRHHSSEAGQLTHISPTQSFANYLYDFIQTLFPSVTFSGHVIVDCKHGATGHLWHTLKGHFNTFKWTVLHSEPLSTFGNLEPNPTHTSSLHQLRDDIINNHANIGSANDPDGDRHVLLDETGTPLTPEETAVIIAHYFMQSDIPLHGLVSTLASSQIIESFCNHHQLPYVETEVGFKYFYPYLKEAESKGERFAAVESSGGFTLSDHTFEKCGILPLLIVIHIMEKTGSTLSNLRESARNIYGRFFFEETAIHTKPSHMHTLSTYLKSMTLHPISIIFPDPIDRIDTRDGLKIVFQNNDWTLIRLSGTEPVIRIYSESSNKEAARSIIDHTSQWISEYLKTL